MKHILLVLGFLALTSCNSFKKAQRAANSGNYIEAMNRSISQLQRNKFNNKGRAYATLLKQSFENYRTISLERIRFLERETLVDNSKPVYENYVRLQNFQNRIRPLLPLEDVNRQPIDFEFYDFTENILVEKENYANYLYTKANDLIRTNDKMDSRLAYNSLVELEQLAPNFRNANNLKRQAYLNGVDYVLVSLHNDSNQVIPKQVEDRLLNFNTMNLDNLWTEFHVNARNDVNYDLAVDINFMELLFSPERLLERQVNLDRDVVDGWRYKKDRNGDFILDRRGNRIKEDVIINARGSLFETIQSKEVQVTAEVNYFDLNTDQKINSYPLESLFVFENRFASFEGNEKVLNEDEIFMLNNGPVPYPPNEKMINDASEEIKAKLKVILSRQLLSN